MLPFDDSYCAILTRVISQAVAIHTFMVVFFHWIPSPRSVWIYRTVIILIWAYTLLFVIVASYTHRVGKPTEAHTLFVRPFCFIQPPLLSINFLTSEPSAVLVLDQWR